MDGCAVRVAARESGDERVNLSLFGKIFTMSPKLSDKKLAVLGAGKLGGILLRTYLKQGLFMSSSVTATVKHAERAAALAKELGVAVTTDNRQAVKGADIILLTVKPQTVAEVLQEIAPEISGETLLVSVAASVPTGFVEQQLAASGGNSNEVTSHPRDAEYTGGRRLRHDCDLWRNSCKPRSSRNCSHHVRRRGPNDCAG